MDHSSKLLQLPAEILTLIGEACNSETLPQARLVCHTVHAAVFDAFATEFLTRLECFVLDPQRLQRVRNILSDPRLAPRVRTVRLSLDPVEAHDARDFSIVPAGRPSPDGSAREQQEKVRGVYIRAQMAHFRAQPADEALLLSFLHDLRHRQLGVDGAPSLEVDDDPARFVYVGGRPMASIRPPQSASWNLLQTVLRSACPVRHLTTHGVPYKVAGPQRPPFAFDGLARLGPGLETFRFSTSSRAILNTVEFRRDQLEDQVFEQCDEFRALVETAQRLRHFELHVAPDHSHPLLWIAGLASCLLRSIRTSELRTLTLRSVSCRVEDLVHALTRARQSLESIRLDAVVLVEPDDSWKRVFACLSEMTRVVKLELSLLSDFEHYPGSCISLIDPKDQEPKPDGAFAVLANSAMDVRAVLQLNLQHGTQFHNVANNLQWHI